MTKIEKEFRLSDETVNCYGYRLLTSGLMLERFNPAIGYLMHDRERGVAIRWEDLVVREGALYGKPVVNETEYPNLAKEIEDGFYAAASVGHIVALELSDDPSLRMEGQTGPTVTRWFPRECSIVDIPGNYNAVALGKLYDEKRDDVLMDLTDPQQNCGARGLGAEDTTNQNNNKMEKVITIATLLSLGLADLTAESSSEQVMDALKALADKAAKADEAEKRCNDLVAEMAAMKEKAAAEKVEAILKEGLADHKLTKELAETLKADYASNPEGLEKLVAAMPKQATVASQLKAGEVPEKYAGKSYNDLYANGELERVKKEYPDLYAKLREEAGL